jgi:hypothetical protein
MKKIVFVEDTYGVGFRRVVIEKLREVKELDVSFNPRIERIPTGKCNSGLRGKVISRTGGEDAKILIVVDTEGRLDEVMNCIDKIFRDIPPGIRISTAFADPRRETWLCIGLGGDKARCRQDPGHELRKLPSME